MKGNTKSRKWAILGSEKSRMISRNSTKRQSAYKFLLALYSNYVTMSLSCTVPILHHQF